MPIKMKDSEKWADLEIALGEYTEEFSSIEEFQRLYYKICDELVKYIELEERKLIVSDNKKRKLLNDIIDPGSYLPLVHRQETANYISKFGPVSDTGYISIINFNYSRTIYRLINFQGDSMLLQEATARAKRWYLNKIIHIHGIANGTETTINLGVNDVSQIKNKSFKTNESILNVMVKPQFNNGSANGINDECIALLSKANMICVFGFSMGDSDKMWCEEIGNSLKKSNCAAIYFVYEDIPANRQQLTIEKKIERKKYFLSKTTLTDQEKENVKDRIWVGYDTKMFALD
jgi:hypothetical protein